MRHIYLCECILRIFIAWTYSSHPWLWPAYVKSRFAFIRTVEIKGLCLQLKRSGTKYAAQEINFSISAVANGCPLPLWKVSLGSDEVLMCSNFAVLRKHVRISRNTLLLLSSRNLNISRNKLYIWNLQITCFKMIYNMFIFWEFEIFSNFRKWPKFRLFRENCS